MPTPTDTTDTRLDRELPNAQYRRAFATARGAATGVLRRRLRVLLLVRDAYDKLFEEEHALAKIRSDLLTLLRLVRAWATRRYRDVPWKTLLYVVGALVYFVAPVDLVPDFFPAIGYVDDVAVITAVVNTLQSDLDAFRAWESGQARSDQRIEDGGSRIA